MVSEGSNTSDPISKVEVALSFCDLALKVTELHSSHKPTQSLREEIKPAPPFPNLYVGEMSSAITE
jgi:hypothetical protein